MILQRDMLFTYTHPPRARNLGSVSSSMWMLAFFESLDEVESTHLSLQIGTVLALSTNYFFHGGR